MQAIRPCLDSLPKLRRDSDRCIADAGTSALVLKQAVHPDVPVYPKYVRAKILRGMHLVQPVEGRAFKTNYTFCSQVSDCDQSHVACLLVSDKVSLQVDVGGAIPPFVMNILTTQDSLKVIVQLLVSWHSHVAPKDMTDAPCALQSRSVYGSFGKGSKKKKAMNAVEYCVTDTLDAAT